jgi:hypothetical protein
MNQVPENLSWRLLYILHFGLTELRKLALAEGQVQSADLADALEILPRYVQHCDPEDLELLRFVLKNYEDKYPGRSFDYLAHLEQYDPPERF